MDGNFHVGETNVLKDGTKSAVVVQKTPDSAVTRWINIGGNADRVGGHVGASIVEQSTPNGGLAWRMGLKVGYDNTGLHAGPVSLKWW